jgi:hypothetical protein
MCGNEVLDRHHKRFGRLRARPQDGTRLRSTLAERILVLGAAAAAFVAFVPTLVTALVALPGALSLASAAAAPLSKAPPEHSNGRFRFKSRYLLVFD